MLKRCVGFAATAMIAAAPLAAAGEIVDVPGNTVERTGAIEFTDPTVEYLPNDSSYGKVIKIGWTINNNSNVHVSNLGTAYWGMQVDNKDVKYIDNEGFEMLMNCQDAATPFRPGERGIHCTQYRLVSNEELAAGHTTPDTPRYRVLYGLNSSAGEYAWVTAAPVASIPLPKEDGKPQQSPDAGESAADAPSAVHGVAPGALIQNVLDALKRVSALSS